jgi:hypothetical protein
MTRRGSTALAWLTLALVLSAAPGRTSVAARAGLPARLSDQEFWRLIDDFSEPNGSFRSDNLVSNEDTLQVVLPELTRIVKPGGVYLGVGPDQNFTYIAALDPRIAFITDIRRGNLQEHLMYKALFELSADRAEFLSRLFSRKRPAGLDAGSSVEELFAALGRVEPTRALYEENLQSIKDLLIKRHGFRLTPDDVAGIEYVYENFFGAGPSLAYAQGNFPGRGMRYPTYQDLQMATDGAGQNRAYLGAEANFRALKTFEEHNLLVPIVGNFAGPKALRAVGTYLKAHDASVSVFYLSNVEQYLFGDGIWLEFAHNIEAMPLEETSTFIRSCFNGCAAPYGSRSVMLLDSMPALLKDVRDGKIRTYADVLWRSR